MFKSTLVGMISSKDSYLNQTHKITNL